MLSEDVVTRRRNDNTGHHQSVLAMPLWNVSGQPTAIQKTVETFTNISCAIVPQVLRKPIFRFADTSTIYSSRGFHLINQLLLPTWLLEGKERYSNEDLKIMYCGVNPHDPYLARLMFRGSFDSTYLRKIPLVDIPKRIKSLDSSISAAVVKCDMIYSSFFEERDFTVIPDWIGMTIDLKPPLEVIHKRFSKTIREDIRRFERHGYSYELKNDEESLNLFYHKMYLPFIKMRHQDKAILVTRTTMKHLLETGSNLMMIKRDDEYVSGLLFNIEKDTLQTRFTGIKEGKSYLRREGIGASVISFSLEWGKEHGATVYNLGSSKPFLKDGLFRYKMKWAPDIRQADRLYFHDHFLLKVIKEGNGIDAFLRRNPFLSIKDGKLQGINAMPLEPMEDTLVPERTVFA